MEAANRISATLVGDNTPSSDTLRDLLSGYKELLMPESAEEREEKAKKVKEVMERENEKGPFQVEPMVFGQRKKRGLN